MFKRVRRYVRPWQWAAQLTDRELRVRLKQHFLRSESLRHECQLLGIPYFDVTAHSFQTTIQAIVAELLGYQVAEEYISSYIEAYRHEVPFTLLPPGT